MITQLRTGPQPVGSSNFEVCYETHWWPMIRIGHLLVCVVNATRTIQRRQTTARKHLSLEEDRPAAAADEGLIQQPPANGSRPAHHVPGASRSYGVDQA